jgi:hypothetical protein
MKSTLFIQSGLSRVFLIFFSIVFAQVAFAQDEEAVEPTVYNFNGNISVTQNGFSFIPTFSLDKPAAVAILSLSKDRFSLEPQFRFELDGMRPWSVIAGWRYKIIDQERFNVRVGGQFPAWAFITTRTRTDDGVRYTEITSQRFLPLEMLTSYSLSEKFSLGTYWLHSWDLENANQLGTADYFALLGSLRNVGIGQKVLFSWNPQVFYLRIDDERGYYTAHTFTLGLKEVPFTIGSTFNKEISSEIGAAPFNWNINIAYNFGGTFEKK